MTNNSLLITTALGQTWFKKFSFLRVFLTDSCHMYGRKEDWEYFDSEIIPHHWNDREKLKIDFDYLKNLYEKLLIPISENLNHLNGTSESVIYWRIIIGPWLIHYLSIVFDRWELLRSAFSDQKCFFTADLPDNYQSIISTDFSDFIHIIQTDEWNFQMFHKIIKYYYASKVIFLKPDKPFLFKHKIRQENKNKNIWKFKIKGKLNFFLRFIFGYPNVYLYQSYFSMFSLIKLNLSLGQCPQIYLDDFSFFSSAKYNLNYRKGFKNFSTGSNFEDYFLNNIFFDMPIVYLEGYNEFKNYVNKIDIKCNKILTANAYWGDDVFKYWLALQNKRNIKIIISEHGGSFPPLLNTFSHEEDISVHKITWFKSYHYKHIQLPPNKLSGGVLKIKNKGKYCSVIGFDSPRYSIRAGHASVIDIFNHNIEFCEALNPCIKTLLRIRPYPDIGWQTKERYIDKLGALKIDSGSYKDFIKNAKLIVCTYPQTTLSEAMVSGKPVILLYLPKFNETIDEAKDLINILIKAKIVFTDPLKAADHVNLNWNNLEEWWKNDEVVCARKLFNEIALNMDKKWVKKWVSFLKNV